MGNWTQTDPAAGDLGQVDGTATKLRGLVEKTRTVQQNVQANATAVSTDTWSGDAATAWKASTSKAATKVGLLSAAFDRVRVAADAYHSAVTNIRYAADNWRQDIVEADHVIHTPYMISQTATDDERREAQRPIDRAHAKKETALQQLRVLANQRQAADDAFVAEIHAAMPSGWETQRKALAAVGINAAGDLASMADARQAMLDLAKRVIDSDTNDADAEDIAALAAMYDLYGDDEAFMSSYYRSLGGEDTVALVDAIGMKALVGKLDQGLAVELGNAVRDGLSVASQSWTVPQGQKFAQGMFDAGVNGSEAVAFLFSNVAGAPLGENLTVSMANILDKFERLDGGLYTPMGPMTGGGILAELDDPEHFLRVIDAIGPVFSTLGHYPDAAFDFLTTGGGWDRVDYWYDERYDKIPGSLWADNYQGPADLWLGSQLASGGPMDPDDDSRTYLSAELSSHVIQALVSNEHFTPEYVSDAASASLASGFMINIQALTEYPILKDSAGNAIDGAMKVDLPSGATIWAPILSGADLAAFLGRVGSNPTGAEALSYGISSYQQSLIGLASLSGEPGALRDALDRVVALQGVVEGSGIGQLIDDAAKHDADREAALDAFKTLVGTIPIPGASGLLKEGGVFLLDWGQNLLYDQASGAIVDGIGGFWQEQTDATFDQIFASEDDRKDLARFTAAASVYNFFGGQGAFPGIPQPLPLDTAGMNAHQAADAIEDYQNYTNDWYETNKAALEAAMQAKLGSEMVDFDQLAGAYASKETEYSDYVQNHAQHNN